jgi:hypothetical protein
MSASNLQVVNDSFSSQQLATTGETASSAVAAQATALVQARYVIALKNPRDMDVVRQRILKECKRPGFADVARYNKPIGNGIVGPSIRFAEAVLRCMGNVVVETVTLFDDQTKRILQVSVTDLEANVPYTSSITVDKTVERKNTQKGDVILSERLNSLGQKTYLVVATEDQLLNKQNALISKAIRTNGLRLVPGDIVEECMDEVVLTQQNRDAKDPDTAKRKLLDSFSSVGVLASDVKKYIGHELTTLNPKEMTDLRELFTAIRDGETTWREAMDAKAPQTGLADKLKPAATTPEKLNEKVNAELVKEGAQ